MILVISHEGDDHAPPVLEHLEDRGTPAALLDLARFPQRLRLSLTCSSPSEPSAVLVGEMDRQSCGSTIAG